MNDLIINYNPKNALRSLSLIVSGCSILFSFYICIKEALVSNYSYTFYCAILLIVISVVLLLYLTLWQPKPLLIINNSIFVANFPGRNVISLDWDNVKELGIGVSYLVFKTKDSKQYEIDLGVVKYDDLKNIKSRIIELCEEKSIPFHNN